MLACIVAASSVALLGGAASAQTVGETMEQWGLLGTWSVDCKRPPSNRNAHLIYRHGVGGRILHERDFGTGRDTHEVQSARIVGGSAIEVIVNFGGRAGTRKWVMIKGPDGRIRAVANSKLDGSDVTIRDGRFTATGAEAPWQGRCRRGSDQFAGLER